VRAGDCCKACLGNARCQSWTANGRGTQGASSTDGNATMDCNLYSDVGPTKTVGLLSSLGVNPSPPRPHLRPHALRNRVWAYV